MLAFGVARNVRSGALAGIVTLSGLAGGSVAGETGSMKTPADPHYRHRFPAEIISHAVWLYRVFSLSLRDVELLLAERGVVASYETVRRWSEGGHSQTGCAAAVPGQETNGTSTRCSSGSGVCSTICGAPWIRSGVVLDVLVQPRRDAKAAKRFFRRLLKGLQYVPRVIVTDKLRRLRCGSAPTPARS